MLHELAKNYINTVINDSFVICALAMVIEVFGNFILLTLFAAYMNANPDIGFGDVVPIFKVWAAMWVIAILINIIDPIVYGVSHYVTRGEKPLLWPISTTLFGPEYTNINSHFDEFDAVCKRIGLWLVVINAITLTVGALLTFTVYSIMILSVVSLAYGALWLARKSYDVSRQLKAHANDPNAHTNSDTRDD